MACKSIATKLPWTLIPRLFPLRSVPQKTKYLPQAMTVRCSGLLPPTQYDTPFPDKMRFPSVLIRNWEIIPLFLSTMAGMGVMFGSIFWAAWHKVDVKFPGKRNNISRTMDLCHPTIHKFRTIEQKYDPWPDMAEVLAKMRRKEFSHCKGEQLRLGNPYSMPKKSPSN